MRARDGVSFIEFALIAPVIVVAITGMTDVVNGYIAWLHLSEAAQAIDQIAVSMAAESTVTDSLDLMQATQAASAVYPYLPDTASINPPPYSVTISSVVMTPTVQGCTSNCIYTAHVAWSGIYAHSAGAGTLRPCDQTPGNSAITQVNDDAGPSPTTLPVDAYSAAPILIVDVTYEYKPMFYTFITGNIQMMQSAYYPSVAGVSGSWIQYVYAAPDATVLCTGYPPVTS